MKSSMKNWKQVRNRLDGDNIGLCSEPAQEHGPFIKPYDNIIQ